MMWMLWNRISYCVQVLTACIIFMLLAKKRSHFGFRITITTVLMLIGAYILSCIHLTDNSGDLSFWYWTIYIIGSVVYVWIGMESSFLEAFYCGIYSCGMQHIAFDFYLIVQLLAGGSYHTYELIGGSVSAIVFVVVYIVGYFFFAKRLIENGRYIVKRDAVIPVVTMILLVWGISIIELSSFSGFEAGVYSHVVYRIIDALCCFYVLWVQINQKEKISLQRELDGINSAVKQQSRQYQITSDTIDNINRKCHDLKHQIRMLREITNEQEKSDYIDELENDIIIYDTALMTGNRALDTVLMEIGLFCKNHHIQWSCMVDGTKLDFMKLEDIYAIFGNALDNAVTAVLDLDEDELKVISVKMLEQKNLLMIQIQNYFKGTLIIEKGLPLTTKKNKHEHGFGMKSIKYTAEKYNGIISIQAENNLFMLQILIPAPHEKSHN